MDFNFDNPILVYIPGLASRADFARAQVEGSLRDDLEFLSLHPTRRQRQLLPLVLW